MKRVINMEISNKPYYTLLQKENNRWTPEFGDYVRSVVKAELEDFVDHGVKRKDLMIIKTNGCQQEIDIRVMALNKELMNA